MSFRKQMAKQKEDLAKAHEEQAARKEDSGMYGSIFNKEAVPEGVQFYKITEGDHEVDIIPFFAGKRHPHKEEGKLTYLVDLYVHQNIGAMNDHFVCPAWNFKEPCPICEWINNQPTKLPTEEWKKIATKRRVVYLVWGHTQKNEEKGLQILEMSYFSLEKHLDIHAKLPRGGGYIQFSHPDKGKTVCFTKEVKGEGRVNYIGHKLADRIEAIPDEILDKSFPLDEIINMHPTYEEMAKAFFGGKDSTTPQHKQHEAAAEPEKKRETAKKAPEPEPEQQTSMEDDVPTYTEPEPEPEKPKAKTEKASTTVIVCPAGGKFGVNIDEFPECGKCEFWDKCADEADKLGN